MKSARRLFSADLWWKVRVLKSRIGSGLRVLIRAPFVYRNWLYFIFGRFSGKPGVLMLRNGLQFWIRPRQSDRASVTEIQMFQPYSQPESGSIVLDIGANIGAFSLQASRTAHKIYAVEPIQSNYEMLCRNVQLNGADTITPVRAAIASEDGVAQMSVKGVTSSLKWQEPGTVLETVPVFTLKRFLEEHGIDKLDYLKMDCEGAEWEILLKSPSSLFGLVHHIELEYHCFPGCPPPQALVDRLRDVGFDAIVMNGDSSSGIIAASMTGNRS